MPGLCQVSLFLDDIGQNVVHVPLFNQATLWIFGTEQDIRSFAKQITDELDRTVTDREQRPATMTAVPEKESVGAADVAAGGAGCDTPPADLGIPF